MTVTLDVRFRPFDTVFFSDGQRFDQDNEGLAEAHSDYPPSPHVLANTFRRLLVSRMVPDWDGQWTDALRESLGDGPWDFGKLFLTGMRILRGDGKACLPAPASTSMDESKDKLYGDRIAEHGFRSDLPAAARWFEPQHCSSARKHEGALPGDHILEENLPDVLKGMWGGRIEGAIISATEQRVGITLDPQTRAARPGMLYLAGLRRPKSILKSDEDDGFGVLSLSVSLPDGLAALFDMEQKMHTAALGGRARGTEIQTRRAGEPAQVQELRKGEYSCYLATPALIDNWDTMFLASAFLGVDGIKIVSCACQRPSRFGPWDPRTNQRGPWLWRVPAGAVWRLDIENDEAGGKLGAHLAVEGLNSIRQASCGVSAVQARTIGFGEPIIVPVT